MRGEPCGSLGGLLAPLLLLLLTAVALSSCGGGGGDGASSSSSSSSSSSAPAVAPTILGQVTTLFTAAIVANPYETSASLRVTDGSSGAVISNAVVTVNDVALTYNTTGQVYEGTLSLTVGAKVNVQVSVNGTTYMASGTSISTFPSISAPMSGISWNGGMDNNVTWSGALPDSTSEYAVGVETTSGTLVYPSTGYLLFVGAGQTSATVPASSLANGSYVVLVGIVDPLTFPGAGPSSELAFGSFVYASFTVVQAPPPGLSSVAISPATVAVSTGKAQQLAAVATFSDGSTQDVTTQATWSSADTSTLTVSTSGLITGVAAGKAAVSAQYGGQTGSTNVTVYALNPSPMPPLSQTVTYQGDYAHSGRVTFGSTAPAFPPTAHWSATLGGTLTSYPVIAGGKVFVTTNLTPTGQVTGNTLYALDEATGSVVWGPVTVAAINRFAAIAYDHGTLFVAGDYGVRSFDAATGTPGWANDQLTTYPVGSLPVAVNGIIYVNTAYALFAVDEVSGSTLWSSGDAATPDGGPAVSPDGVFASLGCAAYKLDLYSGLVLWHFQTDCSGGGGLTPAFANSSIYVRGIVDTTNGPLNRRLDAGTGAQLATFAADASPAFSDTTGFFLSGGTLTARSLSTGSTLWTFTGDGHLISAPFVIDSVVVIASSSGMVYALDTTSGAVLWSDSAGGTVAAPDAVGDPPSGIGAGEGYLVVPAGNVVSAWRLIP